MVLIYPNQKIVTVHKEPADKNHVYGLINKEAAMTALRELSPNEIKLFMYIAFNQEGFQMALSTADIARVTGANVDGIRTAVRGLIKKGYLIENDGQYYDFYEVPQCGGENVDKKTAEDKSTQPMNVAQIATGESGVYKAETKREILHENTVNSKKDYKNEVLSNDVLSELDFVFQRIHVKRFMHTTKRLEEAAGCTPDPKVIERIVSQNWSAFEKGMDETEGYRLATLINLTKEQYRKWDHVIAAEGADCLYTTEQARNMPRMDYDAMIRTEPKEEGLDDISALLDEMFADAI